MYVTFCCVSKPKNEPTEWRITPEGVTTAFSGLRCKDTTFLMTSQ